MRNATIAFSRCAVAVAAALGVAYAGVAAAQGSPAAAGGKVETPIGVKEAGDPRPLERRQGTAAGKSTTSTTPSAPPMTVNEAGEPRPLQQERRQDAASVPPAGQSSVPNPKTPLSVKEAGDPRPLQRREGASSGSAAAGTGGTAARSDTREMGASTGAADADRVKTPLSVKEAGDPRPVQRRKETTGASSAVPPRDVPRAVPEAGGARPPRQDAAGTPPAGSASVPSPKTPLSVKEAGDPRPLQRREGATPGTPGTGTGGSTTTR